MPLIGEIPRAPWLRRIVHDETLLTITDPKATRSYEDKRPGDADVKIIIRSGRTKDETGIDSWTMGLARESVFYAHASILRGASRAFERTLSKDRPRSGFDLLLIEDDPIAFEFMMKWMYGKPFDASPALVTAWAAKGACPVLAMAKRLECDGLEKALKDLFGQAAVKGMPQVTWALLRVCYNHGLETEVQICCSEIAKNVGVQVWFLPERLEGIPIDLLSIVLSCKDWVLDGETELPAILHRWLQSNKWTAESVSEKVAQWDIRWAHVDLEMLEELNTMKIIPEALVELQKAWNESSKESRKSLLTRRPSETEASTPVTPSSKLSGISGIKSRLSTRKSISETPPETPARLSKRKSLVVAEEVPALPVPEEVEAWLQQQKKDSNPDAGATQKLLSSPFKSRVRKQHVVFKDEDKPAAPKEEGHVMFRQRRCFHHLLIPEEGGDSNIMLKQNSVHRGRFLIIPNQPSALGSDKTSLRMYGPRAVKNGKHEILLRILKTKERTNEYNRLDGLQVGIAYSTSDAGNISKGQLDHALVPATQLLMNLKEPAPTTLPPLLTRDIVILLTMDCKAKRISHAISQVVYPEDEGAAGAAAFFQRHSFLDRWNHSSLLWEDLNPLPIKFQGQAKFCIEIESKGLMEGRARNATESSVTIEVLPAAALESSWWIDFMKRTVDRQPRPDPDKATADALEKGHSRRMESASGGFKTQDSSGLSTTTTNHILSRTL